MIPNPKTIKLTHFQIITSSIQIKYHYLCKISMQELIIVMLVMIQMTMVMVILMVMRGRMLIENIRK
jgi:hypothetical protein